MNPVQAPTLSLQGKDKIVCDSAQTIFSFQNKIKLFQRDINTKSLQHFPLPKGLVNSEKINEHVESLEGVLTNPTARFSYLVNLKVNLLLLFW